MEIITIVVSQTGVTVVDGRVKSSRLKYYAKGLEIYVFGKCTIAQRDNVNYHAFEQCRARHIPLSMLKSEGWV